MNKESYIRTKLDVTEFQSDDILTGSVHLIEEKTIDDATGFMDDPPKSFLLNN